MIYVTLEEIKQHLNIDFSDEDSYLSDLIEVAQTSVETYISAPLDDYVAEGKLNPMLRHAIKILAGNFYANREPVAFAEPRSIPYTLDYLVKPFRKYT
jgi:uncharacterized phage protein (possible DNA packaging)